MVHPGYVGYGWDAFNQSPEREAELAVLTEAAPQVLADLRRRAAAVGAVVHLASIVDVLEMMATQQTAARLWRVAPLQHNASF